MSLPVRYGAILSAAVLVTGVLAGCGGSGSGDDDGADPRAAASAGATTGATGADGAPTAAGGAGGADAGAGTDAPVVAGDSRFAVLKLGRWFLSQGVKPIGASRKLYLVENTSFDWYAEYAEPVTDQSVRITAHLRALAAQTAVLKKLGGKVTEFSVGGRKAVWSAPPGAAPVTVLIAWAPNYTIELAASGVEIDDTLALAKALRPADEVAWKKAGGLVIDCPPGGDLCPN